MEPTSGTALARYRARFFTVLWELQQVNAGRRCCHRGGVAERNLAHRKEHARRVAKAPTTEDAQGAFPHFFACTNKNAHFSVGILLQALVDACEFGRRDWTRTNDPHHVKVVL